ncbi:hypothetical protein DRP53_03425 [candidate division WOR-3 bacterium]|uniref:LiaI-LiaF-like transmembrane region domain-containing protein n=1 Tax=candidate division WOR-3 bacterium TaxID=2052148 RepID=A0A660SLL3_UNCW3|nr:MAG: hypothetical protein DRP53_03425 [candidate division WOR-3 bacterium]
MKTTTIIFLIFLGLFFWLNNYHLISFARDWPVILIVIGLLSLLKRSRRRKVKVEVLRDLEAGRITPEEAEEKLKED